MGTPKRLLTSQANELYRAITEAGLDPANFDWTTVMLSDSPVPHPGAHHHVDAVFYRSHETLFAFGRNDVMYSPGDEGHSDRRTARDWQAKVQHFARRLNNIKSEAEPSLWEMITESTTLPAAALDTPPTRFTAEEQGEILARLEANDPIDRGGRLTNTRTEAVG